MRSLTEAQMRALKALPVTITMWGGRPFSGMPEGVHSTATLDALRRRKLVTFRIDGARHHWSITDPGRTALKEQEGE